MKKNMFGISKDGFRRLAQNLDSEEGPVIITIYYVTLEQALLNDDLSDDDRAFVEENMDSYLQILTDTIESAGYDVVLEDKSDTLPAQIYQVLDSSGNENTIDINLPDFWEVF